MPPSFASIVSKESACYLSGRGRNEDEEGGYIGDEMTLATWCVEMVRDADAVSLVISTQRATNVESLPRYYLNISFVLELHL